MPVEVIMPKVDMDMATGRLAAWHVAEGARVAKGAPLFDIETDKAAMEVEAPATGTLRHVRAGAGESVAVGAAIAWIYADGEAAGPAPPAGGAEGATAVLAAEAAPSEAAAGADPGAHPGADPGAARARGARPATPAARRLAREAALALGSLAGSGPRGRVQRADVAREIARRAAAGAAPVTEARRPVPTPAAQPVAAPAEPPLAPRSAPPAAAAAAPPAAPPAAPASAPPAAAPSALPAAPVGAEAARTGPAAPAVWDAEPGDLFVSTRGGEGAPLVMIHGFAADSAGWAPLERALPRDLPLIRIDLPSHGRSPRRRLRRFADLAREVVEAFDRAVAGPAHILGHSLGGAAALALADVRPRQTLTLTLIAPAGLGPEIDGATLAGVARASAVESLAPWLRRLTARPDALGHDFARAAMLARLDWRLRAAQTELAETLFPDGTQGFDLTAALERATAPTMILWGRDDRILPWRQALAAPGSAALHLLRGLGHVPHVEDPATVAGLIARHIRA